jgi:hypothetical protein
MTKLEKIEESVANLSHDEFWRFAEWFAELQAERWDRQIEQDAKAGRLDKVIAQAKAEIAAGKVTTL